MPDAHKNFAYSTIASLPAGGSTDNFDRADNNALGGSWTESENFADALRILTNQLRVSNRPVANQLNRGFAVFGSANPADQFAQIVFKAKVGAAVEAEAGPCVRASAAGTHNSFTGYMLLYGGSTPRIRIVKYVAAPLDGGDGFAGTTILGTFTVTLVANDVLKLEVIGTAIKAFVNGVERISVTDAAIATGEPGVVCRTWFSMNPGAEFNSDWDSWETGQAVNTLTVAAGHGARFPAVPFNATVWPAGAQPTVDNAEIIRVTARTTDTLTFSRAQEGTTQRVLVVGDQVAATITALILTDAELGHAIQDEGVAITQRPILNFAGAGVTVTDDAGTKTLVTIPGGGGATSIWEQLWEFFDTNTDPRDTLIQSGAYRLFVFFSSHNAASSKVATNAVYTVPVGKKLIVLSFEPSSAVRADTANRFCKFRNVTDAIDVIAESVFGSDAATFLRWGGDLGTPSKLEEVVAGKQVRLEIRNVDTSKRAMGGWVLCREVAA